MRLSAKEKKQLIVLAVILTVAIADLCIVTYAPFGTDAFKDKYGFDLLNDKVFYSAEYLDANLSDLPIEAVSNIRIQSILMAVYSVAILITVIIIYKLLINKLNFKWCLALPVPAVALLLNLTQFSIKMIILNKLPEKSEFLYSFESSLNTCNVIAIILTIVLLAVMVALEVISQVKQLKSNNSENEKTCDTDIHEDLDSGNE